MQEWKNGGLFSKFLYSANGLHQAFKTEKAIRNETFALISAVAIAIIMKRPADKIFYVFCASLFPIIIELINTAAERIIDSLLGQIYRQEVKIQKDMLSAAVFLSLFTGYAISLKIILFG